MNQQCETALNKLLQECKTIHNVLQDCIVNSTADDVKDLDSYSVEGIRFSSMLHDRIGRITAQVFYLLFMIRITLETSVCLMMACAVNLSVFEEFTRTFALQYVTAPC